MNTDTPRTDGPCEVPLLELLESIPENYRQMVEINPTEHRNIPYGKHCQDAAKRIRQLERELNEAKQELENTKDYLAGQHAAIRDKLEKERDQLRAEVERLEFCNAVLEKDLKESQQDCQFHCKYGKIVCEQRDQWREDAVTLARSIRQQSDNADINCCQDALAAHERLVKEANK